MHSNVSQTQRTNSLNLFYVTNPFFVKFLLDKLYSSPFFRTPEGSLRKRALSRNVKLSQTRPKFVNLAVKEEIKVQFGREKYSLAIPQCRAEIFWPFLTPNTERFGSKLSEQFKPCNVCIIERLMVAYELSKMGDFECDFAAQIKVKYDV